MPAPPHPPTLPWMIPLGSQFSITFSGEPSLASQTSQFYAKFLILPLHALFTIISNYLAILQSALSGS